MHICQVPGIYVCTGGARENTKRGQFWRGAFVSYFWLPSMCAALGYYYYFYGMGVILAPSPERFFFWSNL